MKTAERKFTAEESSEEVKVGPLEPAVEGTFTRYVRAIAARSEAVEEMAEELCAEFRKVIVRELRWRSLWASPPAYVGILGWPSWAPGDTEGTASPLDDFLVECYLFVFGDRLARLLNQLRVRSKIDGLVVVYLRQFLTKLQRGHDPLGYRLFAILCSATRDAVSAGDLHVLQGTTRIRNETVLGTAPDADPAQRSPSEKLRPLIARWNDELLPELVVAERMERTKVTGNLQRYLAGLETEGVAVLCFKDLLDVLKEDVRARWRRIHELEGGEIVDVVDEEGVRQMIKILRPANRIEELDSFEKLIRCVSNLIPKVEARQKTRVYLERLWNFLRRWSVDDRKTLPANRALERMLKIPRDRFKCLYGTLGQLVRRCQGMLTGSVVEIGTGRHPSGTSAGDPGG